MKNYIQNIRKKLNDGVRKIPGIGDILTTDVNEKGLAALTLSVLMGLQGCATMPISTTDFENNMIKKTMKDKVYNAYGETIPKSKRKANEYPIATCVISDLQEYMIKNQDGKHIWFYADNYPTKEGNDPFIKAANLMRSKLPHEIEEAGIAIELIKKSEVFTNLYQTEVAIKIPIKEFDKLVRYKELYKKSK